MTPKYPQNAPEAPAKPVKQPGNTKGADTASKALAGLALLPPDLRTFLRNRSVMEIAVALRLNKGMASRIKRGIYPHAPHTLLKRWDAARAAGDVPVGAWALRRVLAGAMVHETVLFGGALYSGAGLLGMRGRQIVVTRAACGGLIAQTLTQPAERFALVRVDETAGAA